MAVEYLWLDMENRFTFGVTVIHQTLLFYYSKFTSSHVLKYTMMPQDGAKALSVRKVAPQIQILGCGLNNSQHLSEWRQT